MNITELKNKIHNQNIKMGWWSDLHTGKSLLFEEQDKNKQNPKANVPQLLCLVHSEISEIMEAYRKNTMDAHLPHRKGMEVEIADAIIRLLDLSAYYNFDIEAVIDEKLCYNLNRKDHQKENRLTDNGKKF